MFSLRLKEIREEHHLSQRAFAQIFGISPSTVGMWESGRREPDFDMIRRIADRFNVTTDYLIGHKENAALGFDEFTYAMYEEGKTLTAEHKKTLLEMAKFFRRQQREQGKV
ncbi:MAG: helix-turn-helix domain-containing protein [Oscillospiraceae bacterium]|nr:helix-turn-helix domain-containing protein [Oscillospiraceae bacterium]